MKKIINNKDLTIDIWNSIKVGDSISQGKKPMRVIGVNDKYVIALQNNFGEVYYSIFDKYPSDCSYNYIYAPHCRIKDSYYCGPTNLWGGSLPNCCENDLKNITKEEVEEWLRQLNCGDIEISLRQSYTYPQLTIWQK